MKETIPADVSKCANENCPLRKKCRRYTAESLMPARQVYSLFRFKMSGEKASCDHFLGNRKYLSQIKADGEILSAPQ